MKQQKRECDFHLSRSAEHCGRLSESDVGMCRFFMAHRDDRPDMPGMCKLVFGWINRSFRCSNYKPAYPPVENLPRRQRTKERANVG